MRRILLLFLTCFIVTTSIAGTFYVSNSGNDNNDGLSENSSWNSINKVNSEMKNFVSGDIIAFKRGDEFFGNLKISNVNGIIFTSYGDGEKPVITGSETLNGWTKIQNNIYEHSKSNDVYQLNKGSNFLQNGKLPNKGFYEITSIISQTEFISNDLIGKKNLVGATVHVKSKSWIIDNSVIKSFDSSSGRVTMSEKMFYSMSKGNEFFVQNSISLLDSEGDWSYDKSKGKLYLYSNTTPSNITGSSDNSNGVEILNSRNISVENFIVRSVNNHGIYLNKSYNCQITSNDIFNAYEIGIYSAGGANHKISQNKISGSMYCGIKSETDDLFIESNKVSEIGVTDIIVYKRSWSSSGIAISGDRNRIKNNEVNNVGYNGITFSGRDLVISNNFVKDFCQLLSDGGGIYTYNLSFTDPSATGTLIKENIVIGGSSFDTHSGVFCIYMDDRTHDIIIEGNSLSGTDRGIFLHNTKRIKVTKNNVYDVLGHGISISEDSYGGNGETVDNIIENNEIFLLNAKLYNFPLSFGSSYNNWKLGTSNNNKLFNPYVFENVGVKTQSIFGINNNFPSSMDLNDWQKLSGNDLNSIENNFYWKSFIVKNWIGNNLIKNADFEKDLSNWGSVKATTSSGKETGNNYLIGKSSNENGRLISNHFSVSQNKTYLLEFDIKSNSKTKFQLDIALGESPYGTEDRRQVRSSEEWVHYAIPFKSKLSTQNLKVEFTIFKNEEIHLDNISFHEVNFSNEPLPQKSYFAYNADIIERSINIPTGIWEDLSGNKYTGSISLKPYSSKILILSDGSVSANAGPDQNICLGEDLTLTASGGSSYKWNTGETTKSITVSPTATTTYSVTVSEGNDSAVDEVIVSVNSVTADAGADRTITEGESISLTATGGDSYLWNTGEKTETITVSPLVTTTYSITATSGNCSDTNDVKITVNQPTSGTPIVATAGPDQNICLGEDLTLTASGGSSYKWNTGETTKSITVSPTATTTYSVTVSEGNDSAVDEVIVSVNSVTADAGSDRTITQGETITLVANGGDSYLWSNGSNSNSIEVSPLTNTTYSVIVYKGNCKDVDEVLVNVNNAVDSDSVPSLADAGEDMTICLGESVILNGSGGDIYSWNTGSNSSSIEVAPERTSTYELTASRGGVTTKDKVTITVENCMDIVEDEKDQLDTFFAVYPNPTDGILNIEGSHVDEDYNLVINDYKGSIIYSGIIKASNSNNLNKEMDLSKYVQGIYFLRIFNSRENYIKKIVLI